MRGVTLGKVTIFFSEQKNIFFIFLLHFQSFAIFFPFHFQCTIKSNRRQSPNYAARRSVRRCGGAGAGVVSLRHGEQHAAARRPVRTALPRGERVGVQRDIRLPLGESHR